MIEKRTPIEPVDLAIDDAPHVLSPRAQPAFWEDVSGGLHAINPLDDYSAEAPFGAEALDALSFGHALTAESGLEETLSPRTGHTLIDDCGRRFKIDPDSGIVSLADSAVARREMGRVHAVRVRSIDPFGGVYESTFHLRIAEPLPEVVLPDGADPLGLPPIEAAHPLTLAPPPAAPLSAWTEIAAAHGRVRTFASTRECAPYGAALIEPLAYPMLEFAAGPLRLESVPPQAFSRRARWLDA